MSHSLQWKSLSVCEGIRSYLAETGFATMTPVQAQVIPEMLKGRDVAVEAITGSGKTLAFLLPLVQKLHELQLQRGTLSQDPSLAPKFLLSSIILSPTRELSEQIHDILTKLLEHYNRAHSKAPLQPHFFVGGRKTEVDLKIIEKSSSTIPLQILVSTPGRLMDLLSHHRKFPAKSFLSFEFFEFLIFDEADHLLSSNFAQQVSSVLSSLPKQRHTSLFSATLTAEVENLMKAGLRNALHIKISNTKSNNNSLNEVPASLRNFYLEVSSDEQMATIEAFIRQFIIPNGLCAVVFAATCKSVDFFYSSLQALLSEVLTSAAPAPLYMDRLHSNLDRNQRLQVLKKFKAATNTAKVLLCTDIASRGIDIPENDVVVQLEAPKELATYVHRIGRAGRSQRFGLSLIFLRSSELAFPTFLKNRKVRIEDIFDVEEKAEKEKKTEAEGERVDKLCCALAKTMKELEETLPSEIDRCNKAIRERIVKDREFMLLSSSSFVSVIQAYKLIHLSSIFPFQQLDFAKLAKLYCLFKIPKVKELKSIRIAVERWFKGNADNIAFLDEKKEKQRLVELAEKKQEQKKNSLLKIEREIEENDSDKDSSDEESMKDSDDSDMSDSDNSSNDSSDSDSDAPKKGQPKKATRKIKKAIAQGKKQKKNFNVVERTRSDKREAKKRQVENEWNELAKEERLAKKLKKGKISKEEYRALLKNDGSDSDF